MHPIVKTTIFIVVNHFCPLLSSFSINNLTFIIAARNPDTVFLSLIFAAKQFSLLCSYFYTSVLYVYLGTVASSCQVTWRLLQLSIQFEKLCPARGSQFFFMLRYVPWMVTFWYFSLNGDILYHLFSLFYISFNSCTVLIWHTDIT